jgi:hypothetical protein|tara:strand:- start:1774 stop:2106 length:333 start_codon:yes stop_codon:yes gene_type:complete
MPSKHRIEYSIPLIFGIILLCMKCVRAEEEEDPGFAEIIMEIIMDLLLGFLVGQCQQNPTCNYWLSAFVIVFTVFAILGWCLSGCQNFQPTSRDFRRSSTVYIGSRLASI